MRLVIMVLLLCLPAAAHVEYVVETVGRTGKIVEPGDRVTISYVGTLMDGTEFGRSDSYQFEMGGGRVIPGLEDGVEGMKIGERRRVIIPPEHAYGNRQRGPIPPNSTLIFEVELLETATPVENFQLDKEGALGRPSAWELDGDRPAVFEYMIRDFFTQPWRYQEGGRDVALRSLPVLAVVLLLGLATRRWSS